MDQQKQKNKAIIISKVEPQHLTILCNLKMNMPFFVKWQTFVCFG